MENIIVCYRMACKHNKRHRCDRIVVAIDEGGCCEYEEIDIYKEVEGFKRDWQTDETSDCVL